MNSIVTLDSILDAAPALVPADLFGNGGIDRIISAIETHVRGEVYDVATAEGRERVKSVAYKIARSKTTLDEIGKEHVAAIKAQTAAVDRERKTLRDRLDALKEEVRGPLTRWEDAEANRISEHEQTLAEIIECRRFAAAPSAHAIRQRIEHICALSVRDWQEFKERADEAVTETLHSLNEQLATAEQHERDQAELAELRRMKADREEADRKAAEAKAEADRVAKQQAEEAERERRRAERAEQDKAAAVAAAIEAERQRQEQEKAAERRRQEQEAAAVAAKIEAEKAAEQKRQANARHRAKVHGTIKDALSGIGIDTETANRMIAAIQAGDVPHLSITY